MYKNKLHRETMQMRKTNTRKDTFDCFMTNMGQQLTEARRGSWWMEG